MAFAPNLDKPIGDLSPADLIWPKPFDINCTKPTNGKFDRNEMLSGGWGKIAIISPKQLHLNFGIPVKNIKVSNVINEAFDRLQSHLSVYDVNDVPYTRMHFIPLRKNVKDTWSKQLKNLPIQYTLVVVNLLEIGDNMDKTCFVTDNHVDESYNMVIDRKDMDVVVEINASSCVGVLRALSSLQYSVEYIDKGKFIFGGLPIYIHDKPRFKWRGLMVDTSRHFIPLSRLKKVVDGMERLKLNVFHWHIVDSQSFPFESKIYPNLAAKGAYDDKNAVYRRDEIKDFIEYAGKRGVRIVPEFDLPAHTGSWGGLSIDAADTGLLVRCPNIVKADERLMEHGVDKVALNPLHPKILKLLTPLLNEIFDLFPDNYIHFGGDEVNADCWETNEQIKKWKANYEKVGNSVPWHSKLQGIFTKKIFKLAKTKNKRPIVWDDTLSITDLTEDHVVQWWRGWLPSQINIAHQRNLQTTSSVGYYLDDLSQSWQKMYQQTIDDSSSTLSLGGEAACWDEHADDDNLDHRIFSRLPAVAERLWSRKEATASLDEIDKPRMGRTLCLLKQQIGLNVGPVFPDFCKIPRKTLLNRNANNVIVAGLGTVNDSNPSYMDRIEWETIAMLSFFCWMLTASILCYKFYAGKQFKGKRYVENSYSPVSTEEEEDAEERRLDGLNDYGE